MALPKVNEVLKFTLTVPSTKKTVRYRPYLVKEEKILLQAFESEDQQARIDAMCDTLEACIESSAGIKVRELATFDLEYMFLKVRSKSVGESSDIIIKCMHCGDTTPVSVDLEEVSIEVDDSNFIVDITDSIKVEMKYPTFERIMKEGVEVGESIESVMGVIVASIEAVHTSDERIDASSLGAGELEEFLDSMTADQLKKISVFLEEMPSLKHDIKFDCDHCGKPNELTLRGLSDFF